MIESSGEWFPVSDDIERQKLLLADIHSRQAQELEWSGITQAAIKEDSAKREKADKELINGPLWASVALFPRTNEQRDVIDRLAIRLATPFDDAPCTYIIVAERTPEGELTMESSTFTSGQVKIVANMARELEQERLSRLPDLQKNLARINDPRISVADSVVELLRPLQ